MSEKWMPLYESKMNELAREGKLRDTRGYDTWFGLGYEAAQPAWIKCEERLPEKKGYYLVVKYLPVTKHQWWCRCWFDPETRFDARHGDATVTHWAEPMPLPPLPTEGE